VLIEVTFLPSHSPVPQRRHPRPQALFPKNRNRWKKYSSWEPEPKSKNGKDTADPKFPPDVQVKKGYSWSEELAIAMAALQEAGQGELIEWVKEVSLVKTRRQNPSGD
jgi:replication fork protection complex subunit Tof1/Swi1